MSNTSYLNETVLGDISATEFQAVRPFPWTNPQGFVNADKYQQMLANMPNVEAFEASFGKQRKSGQASHDRYILDYEDGVELPDIWQKFVEELMSDSYRNFVCKLLEVNKVRFRFHWHYTPNGAEVGPHCDSKGKIGSQIFYLNTEQDWNKDWGGETVILDDNGRFPTYSSPKFEDFDAEWPAETMNNRSILFGRRGNSWHGVRQIQCPQDSYRKVFIVVFEEHRPFKTAIKKLGRLLTGKPLTTRKEALTF